MTEKDRLSAAASQGMSQVNFCVEIKYERKKCGKEWLPVHRLRGCRRRSSGHDGEKHSDGMRPRSCQHGQGMAGRWTDGQADGQKEEVDGTVRREEKR